MSVRGVVQSGRRAMTSVLIDACTVTRASTSPPVYDPVTMQYTPAAPTAVFTGACWVRPAQAGANVVEAGDEPVTLRTFLVSLPWDCPTVEVDDMLTVTASLDPRLVGRPLRVVAVAYSTAHVRRQITVEDVDA